MFLKRTHVHTFQSRASGTMWISGNVFVQLILALEELEHMEYFVQNGVICDFEIAVSLRNDFINNHLLISLLFLNNCSGYCEAFCILLKICLWVQQLRDEWKILEMWQVTTFSKQLLVCNYCEHLTLVLLQAVLRHLLALGWAVGGGRVSCWGVLKNSLQSFWLSSAKCKK